MMFAPVTLLAAMLAALAEPPAQPDGPAPVRQWSVTAELGIQALGFFKPVPANPTFSVGGDLRLVKRSIYSLHLGLMVGGFWQLRFMRGAHLDAALIQRLTAPFGLYGALDLSLGGQIAVVPDARYHADRGGPIAVGRPRPHGAARVGLGLELGLDTARWTRFPLRFFVHYRQLLLTPFMLGNDLPAMGAATLTVGTSISLGRNRR